MKKDEPFRLFLNIFLISFVPYLASYIYLRSNDILFKDSYYLEEDNENGPIRIIVTMESRHELDYVIGYFYFPIRKVEYLINNRNEEAIEKFLLESGEFNEIDIEYRRRFMSSEIITEEDDMKFWKEMESREK